MSELFSPEVSGIHMKLETTGGEEQLALYARFHHIPARLTCSCNEWEDKLNVILSLKLISIYLTLVDCYDVLHVWNADTLHIGPSLGFN